MVLVLINKIVTPIRFLLHTTRKRFGQHWLKDEKILDLIIKAANIGVYDRILEVGPGKGALTRKLLESNAAIVHAIEIDKDLIAILNKKFNSHSNFSLKEGDVLASSLIPPDGISTNKVVANIPYNI